MRCGRVLDGALLLALAAGGAPGCGQERCGPGRARVVEVIDGDTVELESGERVRYLLVDTPEITGGKNDCYGTEARDYNRELVYEREVDLAYDVECTDRYDRLLAYVRVDGLDVNALLVQRGFACVLYIPPNGEDRQIEFLTWEAEAKAAARGMWGACAEVACD